MGAVGEAAVALGAGAGAEAAAVQLAGEGGAGLAGRERKRRVAFVEGSAGPELIVVWGALVSIVQVKVAGVGSVLPAGSVARTWKVWEPSVRPL